MSAAASTETDPAPTSEEDCFLQAIGADRTNDTSRLVYADWLDEHGQPDRAEYLRTSAEAAKVPVAGRNANIGRLLTLRARLRGLRKNLPLTWREAVAGSGVVGEILVSRAYRFGEPNLYAVVTRETPSSVLVALLKSTPPAFRDGFKWTEGIPPDVAEFVRLSREPVGRIQRRPDLGPLKYYGSLRRGDILLCVLGPRLFSVWDGRPEYISESEN